MATALYTIGYEGVSLDELLARLRGSGVDLVVDIRALPMSRKRGFSKTPLAEALRAVGIGYVHLREAGNPFRKDPAHALARYAAHLDAAPEIVDAVADVARGHHAALLCYEADVATCHRGIVAPRVASRLRAKVTHL